MNSVLEGVRIGDVTGIRPATLSPEAARSLADRGQVAYREIQSEPRLSPRRRTRLRSAKILDAQNSYLCDALIQDRSSEGMRLLLGRNVGLPARFALYEDESGDIFTVRTAWRRGQAVGVRVVQSGPPTPLTRSQNAVLKGRYYGVKG